MDDAMATDLGNASTPAMCTAWRLFRDHGAKAADLVDRELARCLQARDHEGAAQWRSVSEALTEWL